MAVTCYGIPHRVGACFCEIGKDREASGVIAMTDTSTSWVNCVGNQTRAPGHYILNRSYTDVIKDDQRNDGQTNLVAAVSSWTGYADLDPDNDPKLIVKAKGDLTDGLNSFPSIKITLRPLKTVLHYSYTGNANASGAGEIGFESQDPTQDTLSINYYTGETLPAYDPEDPSAFGAAQTSNEEAFAQAVSELGQTLTVDETHYFKSADRPPEDQTPFLPLNGLELDPKFNPRLPSEDHYDFTRNETYDFKYRFPANFLQKFGTLGMADGFILAYPEVSMGGGYLSAIPKGTWSWSLVTGNFDLNPYFEPGNFYGEEGVAPVIKRWYWDTNNPPGNSLNGFENIFKASALKMTKEIRKRYPFSFLASQERTETIEAFDHNTANRRYYEDNEAAGTAYINSTPQLYSAPMLQTQNTFQAISWWRMEVTADLCNWNSITTYNPEATTQKQFAGATIKGIIKLGMKALEPAPSQIIDDNSRLYGTWQPNNYAAYFFFIRATFGTPSFIYRCKTETYGGVNFETLTRVIEYDGGEIPWEVTLDKDNAKGIPKAFLDFPITSGAELPGGQPGAEGSVPENSLVYIKDFVVTEVIYP